jgi:hypothetical protein
LSCLIHRLDKKETPRSRRRASRKREEDFPSFDESLKTDTLKTNRPSSESSLNIDLIEELNEKRLRRLGEMQTNRHQSKDLGDSDIIHSFLKREQGIPSSASAFTALENPGIINIYLFFRSVCV